MASSKLGSESSVQEQSDVWLITGCSSGFGKRIMELALKRGDRVIATARSLNKLGEAIDSLSLDPDVLQRVSKIQLDLNDGEEDIKKAIDSAAAIWGRIDILINNAGFGIPGLMEEGGSKLLRREFQTNFFGTVDVTTAALPIIRKSSNGRIVFIGSRSTWRAETPGLGHYAASKAAIHSVAETFMGELSVFKIKVLLVQPGAFRTEGIYSNSYFVENPISDYDKLREINMDRFARIGGTEPGDPDKAAMMIVDVVRGEGVAKDRPWPQYLMLGDDAEVDIRNKCGKLIEAVEDWKDVTRGTKF